MKKYTIRVEAVLEIAAFTPDDARDAIYDIIGLGDEIQSIAIKSVKENKMTMAPKKTKIE